MPNNVDNLLTVLGSEQEVARFVRQARGKMPPTGDDKEDYQDSDHLVQPLCFHCLLPLPKEYSQRPYSYANCRPKNSKSGYEMEVETWGIKWGAYEQHEPIVDLGMATYAFTTAWSAPTYFCNRLMQKWLKLSFLLSWGGEGPTRGRMAFQTYSMAGGVDAIRSHRYVGTKLRLHPRWALTHLAKSKGMRFPKPKDGIDPLVDWALEQGYENHAQLALGNVAPRAVKAI